MQYKREIKEWYNKNDILNIYPIGVTTYKRRIKKLNTHSCKDYTRIINKSIDYSNLKTIQVREIHRSLLDELFGDIRLPNPKNITNVIKWVNNSTWNWFGDIVPCKSYPLELKGKMNFVFSRLKKLNKDCKITLFYSIEKNPDDNYYHSHFLIKDDFCDLTPELITEQLELVTEKNTSKETRIYLKPYDYKNYGTDGSNYTLKELQYGFEILK